MGSQKKFTSEKVEKHLNKFTSNATIKGFRTHLKQFFELIEEDPDEYIKDVRLLEDKHRYEIIDIYENDLTKYWKWLINKEYAPKTISNSLNAVNLFFKEFRIYIDPNHCKNLIKRGVGSKPISEDIPLTPDILKKILQHADVRSRAMFLIMLSNGCRIGELVNIRLGKDYPNKTGDIDFNSNPTKILIKYRMKNGNGSVKTKTSRTTYISDEATDALKEWLEYRDRSLEYTVEKFNLKRGKLNHDDRVFPYHTNNVRTIWYNLIRKAGIQERDDVTNRRKIHPHCLRKYFRTYFSKYNRDIAELIMGHEGYLSSAYLRLDDEDLKNEYLKGMSYINIFEHKQDLSELNKANREKDEKIADLQKQMHEMKMELLDIRVKQIEKQNGKK